MEGKVTDTANRLSEMMDYFGIKPIDVCKKLDMASSTLSCYMTRKRIPKQNALDLISTTYGVDPVWLMGYDVPMFRPKTVSEQATEDAEFLLKFKALSERDQMTIKNMIDVMLKNR